MKRILFFILPRCDGCEIARTCCHRHPAGFFWWVLTSPPRGGDRGPFGGTREIGRCWTKRLKTQEPAALFRLLFNIALYLKKKNGITTITDGCGRLGSIPQVDGSLWVYSRRNVWVARPVYPPPYFPFVIFLGDRIKKKKSLRIVELWTRSAQRAADIKGKYI